MLAGMATVLDSTLDGQNANSYVASLGEAEDLIDQLRALKYLALDVSGWDSPGSPESDIKLNALVMAADRIDAGSFIGDRHTNNQARAWSRSNTGITRLNYVIPDTVKLAQVAEAAMLLVAKPQEIDLQARGVSAYTIGKKSVTFGQGGSSRQISTSMSAPAFEILRGAGLVSRGVSSVYLPRG